VPAEPAAAAAPPAAASADPGPAAHGAAPADARRVKAVAAEDSVDKGEEVLKAPPPVAKPEPKPEPKVRHEPEAPKARPEHKPEPKAEHKEPARAEHKLADKPEPKADKPVKPKTEDKPAKPHDDARALAILEGKAADKADKADKEKAAESSQRFVLQVAALSSQDKAAELQAKLRGAGISSHTEKAGELIKVKVGPLNKDEAEKVRAKLGRIGLSGFMTPV
jgi:DedD protein